MTHFYQPDLSENVDSPFVRDGADKLVRRSYWLDMNDRTLVTVMTNGIGAHLTNEEKRAHLIDLRPGAFDRSSLYSGDTAARRVRAFPNGACPQSFALSADR